MLEDIRKRMKARGWVMGDEDCGTGGEPKCDGAVFSHPIGDYMHSTGPYIGNARHIDLNHSDWRSMKLQPHSWFSMELAGYAPWGGLLTEFNLEQQVQVTGSGTCEPLLALQTEFFLVRAHNSPKVV